MNLEIYILKWIKQGEQGLGSHYQLLPLFASIFFAGNNPRFLDLWHNSLPSRFPGERFLQELQSMRG